MLPGILDKMAKPAMAFLVQAKSSAGQPGLYRRTTIKAGKRLLDRIEWLDLSMSDIGRHPDEEVIILRGGSDMSQRGIDFVEDWIANNLQEPGYEPEGDNKFAKMHAEICLIAAKEAGISNKEIEEDVGDLVDRMSEAIESVTDDEVARLVAKDD
jgi:hypothetical protein